MSNKKHVFSFGSRTSMVTGRSLLSECIEVKAALICCCEGFGDLAIYQLVYSGLITTHKAEFKLKIGETNAAFLLRVATHQDRQKPAKDCCPRPALF